MKQQLIHRPNYQDIMYCFEVAKYREKVQRNLGNETGDKNYATILHFIGALGELAVSKIFGIVWDGAKLDELDFDEWRKVKADLGCFEVKTVQSAKGALILRENDKDWATGILAFAPGSHELGVSLLKFGKCTNLQPIYIMGHLPVAVGKQIGEKQVTKYKDRVKIRYVVSRDKLRDREELHKTLDGFNKMRETRQVIPFKGHEFRLTK